MGINIKTASCFRFIYIIAMIFFAGCSDRAESSGVTSGSTALQSRNWQISRAISQNDVPTPMFTSAMSADIVATDSGHALAVWNQYDGLQLNIVAAEYRPGSGWDPPIILSKRQGNSFYPRIKSDSKGNAIVVWQTDKYDLGVIYYSNAVGWQKEDYLPYNWEQGGRC